MALQIALETGKMVYGGLILTIGMSFCPAAQYIASDAHDEILWAKVDPRLSHVDLHQTVNLARLSPSPPFPEPRPD